MQEVSMAKALTFIEPGPVILVTTFDGQKNNVMTISWVMPTDWEGGIVITTGDWNHSFKALMQTKECVVCIPPASMLETVVRIGDVSGADTDKFKDFHLTALSAKMVKAPLIEGCIACLECKIVDYIEKYGFIVMKTTRVVIDPNCKDSRMIHAVGDGTFTVDGEKYNYRELMADKLPPGL